MMNHAELVMRRKNVREFINADSISLVIVRKTDPARNPLTGGMLPGTDQDPLPPQTARIVQNKRRYNKGIVNSEAGEIPHTDYLLLGNHDLDVEVNDTFVWLGINYQVTGIFESRTESKLCSIDLLGERNRNAN